MYLHDLITYSSTKCMKMLSGPFPIQTNSLISFHHQYSVLLHQCTTCKKLLADVSSVDTIENALHRQYINPLPLLVVTVECCYDSVFICDCSSTTKAEQEEQQHYKVITVLMWTKRPLNLCTLIHLLLFFLLLLLFFVFVVTMSFCSFSDVIVDAQWQMNNKNNIITHEQQEQAQ